MASFVFESSKPSPVAYPRFSSWYYIPAVRCLCIELRTAAKQKCEQSALCLFLLLPPLAPVADYYWTNYEIAFV